MLPDRVRGPKVFGFLQGMGGGTSGVRVLVEKINTSETRIRRSGRPRHEMQQTQRYGRKSNKGIRSSNRAPCLGAQLGRTEVEEVLCLGAPSAAAFISLDKTTKTDKSKELANKTAKKLHQQTVKM